MSNMDLEDSDDEEIVYSLTSQPINNGDERPLDIRSRSGEGLRRYKPSLKHILPWRSSATTEDETAKIDQTGCMSYITFGWVFPYLWAAFRGKLSREKRWNCSVYDSTGVNGNRLAHLWEKEVKTNPNPSLFRVTFSFMKTRIIFSCAVFAFCLLFGFIGPTCLIRELIRYVEVHRAEDWPFGLTIAICLFIVEIARVLSYGATWATSYRTGIRVRAAVMGLLFKKLIRARSLNGKTSGEIINIYANDGQRIFDAVTFAPLVIMGPLVLIGGIVYLLLVIGPWSLLGLLVFVVFDFFQIFLGKSMVKYRKLALSQTEKRVSRITEILTCMKTIKMYSWEEPFMDLILGIRKKEQNYIKTAAYAQSLAIVSGPAVPIVATILTFLAYRGTGHVLFASDAFSIVTVFFVMVFGIRMIPYGMRYVAEASVALKNVQRVLMLDSFERIQNPPVNRNLAVVMQDASFGWTNGKENEGNDANLALKNIKLVVEKKKLIGICGQVGSGKTALLEALIGQLVHVSGNVLTSGNIAYAVQDPWILNTSFRDNVLFGETFDNERYYKVLYVCGLSRDINALPGGDQTEIGERGVTLSGGQKARIGIARALYASQREIYLMDNCLAALDGPVAEHVFNYAIKGQCSSGTVLLVTNRPEFLMKCDDVVFMENGEVVDQGSHRDVLERCATYSKFVHTYRREPDSESDGLSEYFGSDSKEEVKVRLYPKLSQSGGVMSNSELRESQDSLVGSLPLAPAESLMDLSGKPAEFESGIKMTDEEEDLGLSTLSKSIYKVYINAAGGYCLIALLLLSFLATITASLFCTVWLSYWLKYSGDMRHQHSVNQYLKAHGNNSTGNLTQAQLDHFNREYWVNGTEDSVAPEPMHSYYMGIYALSLLLVVLTALVKAFCFVKVSITAAGRLHNNMFLSIMHAPMRFFDSTPLGRIFNRFSKDTDEVDVKLPFTLETFLQNCFMVIGSLIVIAWVFPWFLIAAIPLGVLFFLFVACFRAGIRSLKRSENISRSPLFSHISASIQGLSTIHAYGQSHLFEEQFKQLFDGNSGAMFMFQSAMRWLAVWLDLLVVLITLVTSLLVVFSAVPPAYAGMAIALAVQLSGIFQFAVRLQSELEAKMISVERMDHYVQNIHQEDDWESQDYTLPSKWPDVGRISFRDVKLRYRENLPYALSNVSFDIKGREKIGIVGRTGSGKSSIASALFRLYSLTAGTVTIDNVDLSFPGLHELRAQLCTIPQDPALFSGSVRFNLDPKSIYSDSQLWEALDKTKIKSLIVGMGNGLETLIQEGGSNLSVGERQLMCMSRALLRKSKIVVLDEATSNVDTATDQLISVVLREHFSNVTLLVIAHRLESIVDCDKILFMDAGKVIEFDEPRVLLSDPNSRFYQVVKQTSSWTPEQFARMSASV